MNNFRIIVEGKSDQKFIKDCLIEWFNFICAEKQVIETDGKDNLFSERIINDMLETEGKNLIIFDVDDENLEKRHKRYADRLNKEGIDFDIFLLPNHGNEGDLETILLQIANWNEHEFFLKCYQNYLKCLQISLPNGIKHSEHNVPNKKKMVTSYMHFFKQESSETKINFQNPTFWNLQHESLHPLKSFLEKYLQEKT